MGWGEGGEGREEWEWESEDEEDRELRKNSQPRTQTSKHRKDYQPPFELAELRTHSDL